MSHLILDIIHCGNFVNQTDAIIYVMDALCSRYKLRVLNRYNYKFTPQGFTCVYTLAESHFTIHTHPEIYTASIDLYSCRDMMYEMHDIAEELVRRFNGEAKIKLIIKRTNVSAQLETLKII